MILFQDHEKRKVVFAFLFASRSHPMITIEADRTPGGVTAYTHCLLPVSGEHIRIKDLLAFWPGLTIETRCFQEAGCAKFDDLPIGKNTL
jgi:hypothetical protein